MPTGYEESPDYGGPEPTWHGIILGVLAFVALAAAIVLMAIY